ncbi:hypothetical protein NDU88_003462 [Pleurodeles waltl]|uniref:Uncharacterized protein n=1 Tax=Pleurodeles waltl TaxID=8319 RepID=A0AAV7W2F6_PLEWA|nr:hypothetical protein NDU88_003462 [Pleurodeles waltl]
MVRPEYRTLIGWQDGRSAALEECSWPWHLDPELSCRPRPPQTRQNGRGGPWDGGVRSGEATKKHFDRATGECVWRAPDPKMVARS